MAHFNDNFQKEITQVTKTIDNYIKTLLKINHKYEAEYKCYFEEKEQKVSLFYSRYHNICSVTIIEYGNSKEVYRSVGGYLLRLERSSVSWVEEIKKEIKKLTNTELTNINRISIDMHYIKELCNCQDQCSPL